MNHDENTPSLFGSDLRDEGMQAAIDGDTAGHRGWRHEIEEALDALIAQGTPFTADDLRRLLSEEAQRCASPALFGAVVAAFSKRGLIQCVGYGTSTRRARHAGLCRVWTGVRTSTEEAA